MKLISFVLSSLVLQVGAQSMRWDLSLEVESAPDLWATRLIEREFTGRIEVDSFVLRGVGEERLCFDAVNPAFSFSFEFDEQEYSAMDDPAMGFPVLYFTDGELRALDYLVYFDEADYAPGSYLQLQVNGRMSYSPNGVGEFEGSYAISSLVVPEVSTLTLMGLSTIFTFTYRKR